MAYRSVYMDKNLDVAWTAYVEANGGVSNKVLKKLIREKLVEEGYLNGPMSEGEHLVAAQLRQQQALEAEARRLRENENQRARRRATPRKRAKARRYEE